MKKTVSIGLLASLLLSACVVAPAGRPYYGGEGVYVEPPPPRVEYVGPPPVVGQIWIQGYWNWTGSRHEWVPGRWEASRPGYRWVPHSWERQGDRWHQRGGRWEEQRDRGDDRHDHRERRGW